METEEIKNKYLELLNKAGQKQLNNLLVVQTSDKPLEVIVDKTYFKLGGDDNDGEGDCENENSKQGNSSEDFFNPNVEVPHWSPNREDEKEENEVWFGIPSIEELKEEESLLIKVKKKYRW